MTRFYMILMALILATALVACESSSGSDTHNDTADVYNPADAGNDDIGESDDVVDDDIGDEPDVGEDVGTDTGDDPCNGGLVPLTIDNVTECVEEEFANTLENINGLTFVRTEPNDGNEETAQVYHISVTPQKIQNACPESLFILQGMSPVNGICIEEDLSLSLSAKMMPASVMEIK